LQLKPDFAEAHLLAGNVLLKVGQQQRADQYEEYLRLAPKGDYAAEARRLINRRGRRRDASGVPKPTPGARQRRAYPFLN
jgi:hypothetical protein